MSTEIARVIVAKELTACGHDAGVHPIQGVVIFYNGFVWRVAGGDMAHPSMMMRRELYARDVEWITKRERKDAAR